MNINVKFTEYQFYFTLLIVAKNVIFVYFKGTCHRGVRDERGMGNVIYETSTIKSSLDNCDTNLVLYVSGFNLGKWSNSINITKKSQLLVKCCQLIFSIYMYSTYRQSVSDTWNFILQKLIIALDNDGPHLVPFLHYIYVKKVPPT